MDIQYLHQYFNTPDMPGSTRSFEMARRLVAAGHKVDIITSWREPTKKKSWFTTEEDGIKVHWLPLAYSNHMEYRNRIKAFFRFAIGAGQKAASIKSDVVFATSTPLTIALPGVYSAKRNKVPMVFEVRDLWPELPIAIGALKNPISKWLASRLELFAYNNSERIIALSPGMRDGIIKRSFPANKVKIVPNISDIKCFSAEKSIGFQFREKHGIAQNSILVVYTGTFGRINGVDYLIRLAKHLQDDKNIHFLTLGEGQEFKDCEKLAISLDVMGKNLTMLSAVPKTYIPTVLSAADISTSLFIPLKEMEANSANKFFDGLAAGCCMAINYGGWHSELLSEYKAGIQLSTETEKAAKQLKTFVNSNKQLETAKKNAMKLARERFSVDELAKQFENILLEAANNYRA